MDADKFHKRVRLGYLGACPRIEKNDQMRDTGEYKIRPYLRTYHYYCCGFRAIVGANLGGCLKTILRRAKISRYNVKN